MIHFPTGDLGYCWAPSQYPKRRLSVRSRKVSKPRDLSFELSDGCEIWQALRQRCCRCACQISKRYDNLKYQSRGFETLRDLTKRCLFGYWDGTLWLWSPRRTWPSLTSLHLMALTHWAPDKMATISQTAFSIAFSWITVLVRLKFHWNFVAIIWINESLVYWRIYTSLGLDELSHQLVHTALITKLDGSLF